MKKEGPFPSLIDRREASGKRQTARPGAFLPFLLFIAVVLSAASCADPGPAPVRTDLILIDGAVYTMDRSLPKATAVAVSGGRIIFVGGDRKALQLRSGSTMVIDLHGKMVLPGFQDSRIHMVTARPQDQGAGLREDMDLRRGQSMSLRGDRQGLGTSGFPAVPLSREERRTSSSLNAISSGSPRKGSPRSGSF